MQPRGDGLGDQPARAAVLCCDLGGFVEMRSRIEHFEHMGMWSAQDFAIRCRQDRENLAQLSCA